MPITIMTRIERKKWHLFQWGGVGSGTCESSGRGPSIREKSHGFFGTICLRALATVCLSLLGQAPSFGAEELSSEQQRRFSEALPNVAQKLFQRQPLHVAILGEASLLLHPEGVTAGRAFLDEFSEAYFYTGGVHSVYDAAHLEITSPKITYEEIAIPNPSCFNLTQHLSTLGLLNEPDLVVLIASAADATQQVGLPTYIAAFDAMKRQCAAVTANLLVIGPSALSWDEDEAPSVDLRVRAYTGALREWARKSNVPFYDADAALFPRSVLFSSKAKAGEIWQAFKGTLTEIKPPNGKAHLPSRIMRAVGKGAFHGLINPPSPPRFSAAFDIIGEPLKLKTTLANETAHALSGLAVPCLLADQLGILGRPFTTDAGQATTFEIDLPSNRVVDQINGRVPVSMLVIDDRRLHFVDGAVPKTPVSVVWPERQRHNHRGQVPVSVRCEIHRHDPAWQQVTYRATLNDQKLTEGKLALGGTKPAPLELAFDIPNASETDRYEGELILTIEHEGKTLRFPRLITGSRQLSLQRPTALLALTSSPKQGDDELDVFESGVSLLTEASEEEISFHFDFRGIEFRSTIGEPALQLDLAIDGRSFERRLAIGYVGVLRITCPPDDDPATLSPFAMLAHFGNGYARRPLPPGIQARLSTRPNGDRRMTIQMTRDYFYQHGWTLGNGNSGLGIRATLKVLEKDMDHPSTYVLHRTQAHPNNAEGLTIVEFTDQPSSRWSLQFSHKR